MALSSVILSDPEWVWLDKGAKSVTYFCRKNPVRVDAALISQLKEIASRVADQNVRLCLHDNPSAPFHEMIIFERKGKYYRPHKHFTKGESYHVIEGSMAAFVFEEDGRVADTCLLGLQGNLVYRVGANMYHAVMPLSDFVIYHESKPGPFLGEEDSIYPPWAPDETKVGEVTTYTKGLQSLLAAK